MKEFLLVIMSFSILAVLVENGNEAIEDRQKQYTLDSLHYERQEAKQDSIINKLDLIYGDVRRSEDEENQNENW